MDKNDPSLAMVTEPEELNTAKELRQKYFFGKHGIQDPYTWTFNHSDHKHFVLYKNNEIIGYAHIQFFPNAQAGIRIIVIEAKDRNQGYGKQMLNLIEKWLKEHGYISILCESNPEAVGFYRHLGYTEMPFPESSEDHNTKDIALGKLL